MKGKYILFHVILGMVLFFIGTQPMYALGTHANGWMYVEKIKKLESRGLMFDSWEGIFQVTSYDKKEKCDKKKDECFTAAVKEIPFSINKKNTGVSEYLRQKNVEGNFLVHYRKHKIEKITLSSRLEVLEIIELTPAPAEDLPRKMVVKKTGYRNFSLEGEILDFSRQGWCVKTYEGLYRDTKTNLVHPFSVTQKPMAEYVFKAMKSKTPFNIGISDAIVKGLRKSDYDIFEINYDEKAGSSL